MDRAPSPPPIFFIIIPSPPSKGPKKFWEENHKNQRCFKLPERARKFVKNNLFTPLPSKIKFEKVLDGVLPFLLYMCVLATKRIQN